MNRENSNTGTSLPTASMEANLDAVIKIAIMAVGGQGGGVLTQWIETLARAEGYAVQATSVAGVAQRTGATIYYIEMVDAALSSSRSNDSSAKKLPVFSLAPAEGDVDILIAAELMEAGRAIMRGFVSPYKTTLIASTHRAHAVSEKMVPGFGISDSEPVIKAAQEHSLRSILLDMESIAVSEGTVISASLFGALAASRVLPFETTAFEQAIRSGDRGVEKSLQAFRRAIDEVTASEEQKIVAAVPESELVDSLRTINAGGSQKNTDASSSSVQVSGPDREIRAWNTQQKRAMALPKAVQDMALAGLVKVLDFQDMAYAEEYLDRLENILAQDSESMHYVLTLEAAKYIANAMAYDDVIRVADLKTRDSRFVQIRQEMQVSAQHRLKLTEYMHPRGEELLSMLPEKWATRISQNTFMSAAVDRVLGGGRRWRSDRITGFLPLYTVAGLRKWRRRSLRHSVEVQHLEDWLEKAMKCLPDNYELAVEVIKCQRLIKGYSDTHARGQSKFSRIINTLPLLGQHDEAAGTISKLREAALADEKGVELDNMLEALQQTNYTS